VNNPGCATRTPDEIATHQALGKDVQELAVDEIPVFVERLQQCVHVVGAQKRPHLL